MNFKLILRSHTHHTHTTDFTLWALMVWVIKFLELIKCFSFKTHEIYVGNLRLSFTLLNYKRILVRLIILTDIINYTTQNIFYVTSHQRDSRLLIILSKYVSFRLYQESFLTFYLFSTAICSSKTLFMRGNCFLSIPLMTHVTFEFSFHLFAFFCVLS